MQTKHIFITAALCIGFCVVPASVVPVTLRTNPTASVTFSGTIPTWSDTDSGTNSAGVTLQRTYTVESTSPRPSTASVTLRGSALINRQLSVNSVSLNSNQSVTSAKLPDFLYNFSGKVQAETVIENGQLRIETGSGIAEDAPILLDITLEKGSLGTATSYDWDFSLKYGALILAERSDFVENNYHVEVPLLAGRTYYFDFLHTSYTFERPLSSHYTLNFSAVVVPEPTTLLLLGLGGVLLSRRK